MLSDGEILDLLKSGHLNITPFDEKNMTPNGYDLCIGGIEVNEVMMTPENEKFIVSPLTPFRVISLETVTLSNGFVANLWLKQRYARRGIQATFSQIDAEFYGTLSFGGFNGNGRPFEFEVGAPFAQIVFDRLEVPPIRAYSARSGHYKGQKNVILK